MKVIMINGSPRKNGVTAAVLHKIEKNLKDKGIDVEFYNLSDIEMFHCKGCCSCYRTGHCCIRDDAEILSERIAEADGLVFGSPTYASNVSGLMKDFIDRGHFVIEQLLHNKYCVTVATGENYGYRDALKVLNNLVLFSGGCLCDKILIKAPFNDIQSVDDQMNVKAVKAAERMYKRMGGRKPRPLQRFFNNMVLSVGIRPLVKRKGAQYQGVADKWIRIGIRVE
jgi:multimeric flavodoxin WrbA